MFPICNTLADIKKLENFERRLMEIEAREYMYKVLFDKKDASYRTYVEWQFQ